MNWKKPSWIIFVLLCPLLLSGCGVHQIPVSDAIAGEALQAARQQIDVPYELGGRGLDVFDCSGLITWAYKSVYPNLRLRIGSRIVTDANMDQLWRYNVIPVDPAKAKPGDIVFVTSNAKEMTHGGLFIRWIDADTLEFINASSYWGHVVVDSWPRSGTKRDQWFVGIGRLLIAE